MTLSVLDISIIITYIVGILFLGFYISKKASKDLQSYFLGGNKMKWYYLGLSNASGMFDTSGTMWTVSILFIYGLKSAWIPWLWPVWNQVFIFVYLAIWMRRSGVMTGAQWITFKFGEGKGANLTRVRVMLAPKLAERLDAFVARQPEPKPTRGKAVKMLMRRALDSSTAGKKPSK